MAEIVTDMNKVTKEDFGSVEWADVVTGKIPEGKALAELDSMDRVERESLKPKYDSVAAFKLHRFSTDFGSDEDHGDAVDWHRWSALFRNVTGSGSKHKSEQPAAMLHVDSQGFVTAEWYGDGNAAEEVWASLVKEWDEYNSPECEGHYDTDDALTSGVGIGEAIYCDGSCQG
ncbi:hypothetical protein [Streptomyces cucumeris]|uniref:hypothetical protein n=1 Tax=Streptomyces cucumeris TaxID=2962890 RepID=UPI0020C8C489|nr:hypothetical protein [Streptomyces sp. NEAU-Y11]MCP9209559.1 hypothetical protein [Streptomyces sp. NEAU-Y11]